MKTKDDCEFLIKITLMIAIASFILIAIHLSTFHPQKVCENITEYHDICKHSVTWSDTPLISIYDENYEIEHYEVKIAEPGEFVYYEFVTDCTIKVTKEVCEIK